jgi:hypothetical protein
MEISEKAINVLNNIIEINNDRAKGIARGWILKLFLPEVM